MWATQAIQLAMKVLFWPVNIVALVTTFLGGVLMGLPIIGLVFILLLSILWLPFFGILLGSAWLWHRGPPFLRPLVALIGVPVGVLGWIYCSLVPGGGEPEDMAAKRHKQVICVLWPYAHESATGGTLVQLVEEEEGTGFFGAVLHVTNAEVGR